MNNKKPIKAILTAIISLIIICFCVVLGINAYVKATAKDNIIRLQDAEEIENADFILVLGCKVKENGVPSPMLADRLKTAIELSEYGYTSKILMSGDRKDDSYDEVGAMASYAIKHGIDDSDILQDPKGYSTYESLYRAKTVFNAKKIIIVTQKYHLYRALYIAQKLGIEAYGVPANLQSYQGQSIRDVREILARNKDFLMTLFYKDKQLVQ